MIEDFFDPVLEGRRIANSYLSKRGWTQEWRRTLNQRIHPSFQRQEFEDKQRQCDQLEEDAEAFLSAEVERWRHDHSPQAKEVLRTILAVLGGRTDLGFFAQKIMGHISRYLGPFQV
ncbi:hypothetical protein A2291_01090 [candidate division WOR-1 bacterium RIFOXYB2_FULL_42_35]|uniref:Uncharacterized protein n=1 Tax=candidate division WOR-1 bacterium RIFOXYC2_FULL_41_25 TaxID=1802586 RepID=A0A1F4TLU6_UNCSA|nr:MAG: hypothetical protein A2247_02725 [candidate division WOR-1 bacterium RIFOXYA2_FULL_41_14]OGC23032.1 MAG: hypothetical protein A2291_01090 [candidate division WOR-1 bacterium RIFOXYB2_FULL_42_35]OGC33490.1 MAG: hypothetical protein A2462_06870 [candidate division WOR-1 bacterium RIFOXYC2_FULL_41_25]OGC44057.1 MAG: hypothetical protein A2548_02620 [candidate division WOR-1 bacterium RIFOXYD2_FULL_41_8]